MSRAPKLRNSGIEESCKMQKSYSWFIFEGKRNFKTIKDSCDKIINKVLLPMVDAVIPQNMNKAYVFICFFYCYYQQCYHVHFCFPRYTSRSEFAGY